MPTYCCDISVRHKNILFPRSDIYFQRLVCCLQHGHIARRVVYMFCVTTLSRIILQIFKVSHLVKTFRAFYGIQSSLSCSQEPTARFIPKPIQSSPGVDSLFLQVPFTQCHNSPNCFFPGFLPHFRSFCHGFHVALRTIKDCFPRFIRQLMFVAHYVVSRNRVLHNI